MIAYRLLTAPDDSAFCHKVTKALADGWMLHGSPQYAYDHHTKTMMCAQAVTKEVTGNYDPELKLGQL